MESNCPTYSLVIYLNVADIPEESAPRTVDSKFSPFTGQ